MAEEYLMHLSFKEIVSITLIVITSIITLYAVSVYKLLSNTLRNQARSEASKTMLRLGSKMLIYIAYVYWEDYKITKKKEYLDMAIDVTEDAYNDFAKDLEESEHEYLICKLKNNLAYYYAARRRSEDGVKAQQYAKYILEKSQNFDSTFKDGLIDTYRYVQQRFPKSQLDIYLKKSFLFSWDNVPGNDNEKLLKFLRDDLDISWAENAEILKPDDGKTICIRKDKNSAEIIIDEKKENATLKISDGRTHDLEVKKENGKLNIYKKLFLEKFPKKELEK